MKVELELDFKEIEKYIDVVSKKNQTPLSLTIVYKIPEDIVISESFLRILFKNTTILETIKNDMTIFLNMCKNTIEENIESKKFKIDRENKKHFSVTLTKQQLRVKLFVNNSKFTSYKDVLNTLNEEVISN